MAPDRNGEGRKTTKQWLYFAIVLWAVSFIIMAAFSTFALIRSQQLTHRLCEVTDDNRTINKKVLRVAKQQALEAATDAFARELVRQRYNELLALIPPLKCTVQGGPQELEP